MEIEIANDARELGIFIYACEVLNVEVKKDKLIEEELKKAEAMFVNTNLEDLKNDPVVRSYREFYWRIGIDPTKTRPSGEALRRRVARGNPIPRINNIVDAGNIASLITLVSIGIYDLDKIKGSLKLTLSKGGETFIPIGSDKPVILNKGFPILIDDEGKILHLYPHKDSELTKITENTRNILIISAGIPFLDKGLVKKALEITAKLISFSCSSAFIKEIKEIR
jgi:DNA/RNA-binding domain of Phe-tRNA-synthetase-like protein